MKATPMKAGQLKSKPYLKGIGMLIVSGSPNIFPLIGRFHDHLLNDDELPFVETVLLRGGCGDKALTDLGVSDCKGLVVAGFGGGTMPDNFIDLLAKKASSGCSRATLKVRFSCNSNSSCN